MQKITQFLAILISLFTFGYLVVIGKEVRILKKKNKQYNRFFSNVEKGYQQFTPFFGGLAVPYALQNVPYAEDTGVVLDVRTIEIRDVLAPYNASIVEYGNEYLLVFRYDVMLSKKPGNYHTHVGYALLDKNFQQTEEPFHRIDTGSDHSEDPRILKAGDSFYLIFNDAHPHDHNCRTMRIGKLNLEQSRLEYATNLDLQLKPVEKNWVPFEYVENGLAKIHFEYLINPHKVFRVDDPQVNAMTHLVFPDFSTYNRLFWPEIWGDSIRGGTPAKKVDDMYLGFFHSFFWDENKIAWYVMGAYTFEEAPPFRMSAVSHYPILYKGIYDSPPLNTAWPSKRVVFPAGFVEGKQGEKEVIYLICAENDSAVKLITIDKKALLKGLKKI